MPNKIKFAVVGCGHIGKRHAEMVTRNEDSELVALIDVKDKSVLGIENYDVPFYKNLESYLETNPDVDVVSIATPNGFHADQAMKCLEAKNISFQKTNGAF